jgi:hypothetical protein
MSHRKTIWFKCRQMKHKTFPGENNMFSPGKVLCFICLHLNQIVFLCDMFSPGKVLCFICLHLNQIVFLCDMFSPGKVLCFICQCRQMKHKTFPGENMSHRKTSWFKCRQMKHKTFPGENMSHRKTSWFKCRQMKHKTFSYVTCFLQERFYVSLTYI